MAPALSVVVCTRNRLASLKRCVEAFDVAKANEEWELVIVDNGSSDGTAEYLRALPKVVGLRQTIITCEPQRGLGRARNKGIKPSRADIVSFTDDDCYVTEDYITAMLAAFRDRPGIGFVGGRILLYDKTDLRLAIDENENEASFQPRTVIAPGAMHGANMAFRRRVLDQIGGFDDRFGVGTPFCTEDTCAQADALWAGFAGVHDPRPTVFHHHGRKTKEEFRAVCKIYETGIGAYYAKYILRRDTRSAYIRKWIQTALIDHRRAGLDPKKHLIILRRSLREIVGGLRYYATLSTRAGLLSSDDGLKPADVSAERNSAVKLGTQSLHPARDRYEE